MTLARILIGVAAVASVARAQSNHPPGWRALTDGVATLTAIEPTLATEWRFTQMAPGWHITTRPAALMFDPGIRASGVFTVESMQILFPGTTNAGYGVFLGGQNLESEQRKFIAFLLHRDGRVSIERHEGKQATQIVAPTPATSFKPAPAGETADNLLRVAAAPDSVRVSVNGTVSVTVPRNALSLDGHIGFRTGADLNLHVTTLDFTQRLAPVRR